VARVVRKGIKVTQDILTQQNLNDNNLPDPIASSLYFPDAYKLKLTAKEKASPMGPGPSFDRLNQIYSELQQEHGGFRDEDIERAMIDCYGYDQRACLEYLVLTAHSNGDASTSSLPLVFQSEKEQKMHAETKRKLAQQLEEEAQREEEEKRKIAREIREKEEKKEMLKKSQKGNDNNNMKKFIVGNYGRNESDDDDENCNVDDVANAYGSGGNNNSNKNTINLPLPARIEEIANSISSLIPSLKHRLLLVAKELAGHPQLRSLNVSLSNTVTGSNLCLQHALRTLLTEDLRSASKILKEKKKKIESELPNSVRNNNKEVSVYLESTIPECQKQLTSLTRELQQDCDKLWLKIASQPSEASVYEEQILVPERLSLDKKWEEEKSKIVNTDINWDEYMQNKEDELFQTFLADAEEQDDEEDNFDLFDNLAGELVEEAVTEPNDITVSTETTTSSTTKETVKSQTSTVPLTASGKSYFLYKGKKVNMKERPPNQIPLKENLSVSNSWTGSLPSKVLDNYIAKNLGKNFVTKKSLVEHKGPGKISNACVGRILIVKNATLTTHEFICPFRTKQKKDAIELGSTWALFQLSSELNDMSSEEDLLPPCYRSVYQSWVREDEEVRVEAFKQRVRPRVEFCVRLGSDCKWKESEESELLSNNSLRTKLVPKSFSSSRDVRGEWAQKIALSLNNTNGGGKLNDSSVDKVQPQVNNNEDNNIDDVNDEPDDAVEEDEPEESSATDSQNVTAVPLSEAAVTLTTSDVKLEDVEDWEEELNRKPTTTVAPKTQNQAGKSKDPNSHDDFNDNYKEDSDSESTSISKQNQISLSDIPPLTTLQDLLTPKEIEKTLQADKELIQWHNSTSDNKSLSSDSGSPYQRRLPLIQTRQQLPVHEFKQDIIRLVNHSRVSIVSGATGSGKTTQVPQYVMEEALLLLNQNQLLPNIIVTEPRRISAVSVGTRVAEELGENVGEGIVGYQIRLEKKAHPRY